jgi:hypothetical protein
MQPQNEEICWKGQCTDSSSTTLGADLAAFESVDPQGPVGWLIARFLAFVTSLTLVTTPTPLINAPSQTRNGS